MKKEFVEPGIAMMDVQIAENLMFSGEDGASVIPFGLEE